MDVKPCQVAMANSGKRLPDSTHLFVCPVDGAVIGVRGPGTSRQLAALFCAQSCPHYNPISQEEPRRDRTKKI